jgi:hypothetical protein
MLQVDISGIDKYKSLVERIKKNAPEKLNAALFEGGLQTQNEAKRSIQSHQSSGVPYKRGGVVHVASAPDNPPNTDTGNLVNNITLQKIHGGYDVGSRDGAPYGAALEFGTSRMLPRPWLVPAATFGVKAMRDFAKRMKLI